MKREITTYLVKLSSLLAVIYAFNIVYPNIINQELKELTGSLNLKHVVLLCLCSLR